MRWSAEWPELLDSLVAASHHNRALGTAGNPRSPAIDRPLIREPPVAVLNCCLPYQSLRLRQSRSRSHWEVQTPRQSPRHEENLHDN